MSQARVSTSVCVYNCETLHLIEVYILSLLHHII